MTEPVALKADYEIEKSIAHLEVMVHKISSRGICDENSKDLIETVRDLAESYLSSTERTAEGKAAIEIGAKRASDRLTLLFNHAGTIQALAKVQVGFWLSQMDEADKEAFLSSPTGVELVRLMSTELANSSMEKLQRLVKLSQDTHFKSLTSSGFRALRSLNSSKNASPSSSRSPSPDPRQPAKTVTPDGKKAGLGSTSAASPLPNTDTSSTGINNLNGHPHVEDGQGKITRSTSHLGSPSGSAGNSSDKNSASVQASVDVANVASELTDILGDQCALQMRMLKLLCMDRPSVLGPAGRRNAGQSPILSLISKRYGALLNSVDHSGDLIDPTIPIQEDARDLMLHLAKLEVITNKAGQALAPGVNAVYDSSASTVDRVLQANETNLVSTQLELLSSQVFDTGWRQACAPGALRAVDDVLNQTVIQYSGLAHNDVQAGKNPIDGRSFNQLLNLALSKSIPLNVACLQHKQTLTAECFTTHGLLNASDAERAELDNAIKSASVYLLRDYIVQSSDSFTKAHRTRARDEFIAAVLLHLSGSGKSLTHSLYRSLAKPVQLLKHEGLLNTEHGVVARRPSLSKIKSLLGPVEERAVANHLPSNMPKANPDGMLGVSRSDQRMRSQLVRSSIAQPLEFIAGLLHTDGRLSPELIIKQETSKLQVTFNPASKTVSVSHKNSKVMEQFAEHLVHRLINTSSDRPSQVAAENQLDGLLRAQLANFAVDMSSYDNCVEGAASATKRKSTLAGGSNGGFYAKSDVPVRKDSLEAKVVSQGGTSSGKPLSNALSNPGLVERDYNRAVLWGLALRTALWNSLKPLGVDQPVGLTRRADGGVNSELFDNLGLNSQTLTNAHLIRVSKLLLSVVSSNAFQASVEGQSADGIRMLDLLIDIGRENSSDVCKKEIKSEVLLLLGRMLRTSNTDYPAVTPEAARPEAARPAAFTMGRRGANGVRNGVAAGPRGPGAKRHRS